MAQNNNADKFPSELRFDLVGQDWVVIATGRAKRPETFKKEKRKTEEAPSGLCPFCKIETQEKPTVIFKNGVELAKGIDIPRGWTAISIPNKYPAFVPSSVPKVEVEGGVYRRMRAVGFHEVVVTSNHKKSLALLTANKIKEVIDVYHARYQDLMKYDFVSYISIFHNHGKEAGASISHPHSQIITTPLIDNDLKNSLNNASEYREKNNKCVYCVMDEWEAKDRKRIVYENDDFLAICPFASKSAFEVIISPKRHLPYFEKITELEKRGLADAFRAVLKKIYKGLNDPAYNFYLHSAPCDGHNYDYYHWHWTILPKTATWAGFEMGTRIEISTIEPEKAAEFLRKQ
jgi:UDPglucose--hexose-1-phosphate uridylyltransferase